MLQFFQDAPENPFLLSGLLAGVLASIACGAIGPHVVVRRIVFLAGAIAHMAVGGVGVAIWARSAWPDAFDWFRPIHGALIAAVLASLLIGVINHRAAERVDTLIGAMWAVGMSLGIMLMKFTPGYQVELMGYLFGNLAYVSPADLRLMAGLNVAIVITVLLFHKRLLAMAVDPEQCRLQGISILATDLLLLVLVALTVICLVQVVGLILVLALLTLPAATASHHVRRLGPIMIVAMLLSMALTTLPRIAVYGTLVSPESAIVIAAAAVYLLSLGGRSVWRALRIG